MSTNEDPRSGEYIDLCFAIFVVTCDVSALQFYVATRLSDNYLKKKNTFFFFLSLILTSREISTIGFFLVLLCNKRLCVCQLTRVAFRYQVYKEEQWRVVAIVIIQVSWCSFGDSKLVEKKNKVGNFSQLESFERVKRWQGEEGR